jgi:hypothetical protein
MNSNLRLIAFVIRPVEASHGHAASLSTPILATVAALGLAKALRTSAIGQGGSTN